MILLLIAALAGVGALPVRTPSEPWVVNFHESQCLAQRNFGTSDHQFLLVLKQPPKGNVMQVAIVQERGAGDALQYDGTLTFDDHKPLKLSVLQFRPKLAKVRTYLMNVPLEDFAAANSAKTLTFSAPGIKEKLSIPGMSKLLSVMNECVVDLRRVWNVQDPDASASSAPAAQTGQAASGDLSGLFSAEDYPGVAVERGQSGTVQVLLLVNERGQVADCSILETSGVASLDGQVCAVIRGRAKFNPATTAAGKPAKSAFIQRITFRIAS